MSNTVTLKKFILFLGDIFFLYISLWLTLFLRLLSEFNFGVFILHLLPFSIIYFFWIIIFYIAGLYDLHLIKTKLSFYGRVLGAITGGLILGMLFFYSLPVFGISPKTNLVLNTFIFGVLFLGWRHLFYTLFSVHFVNKVAIIGEGPKIENLKQEINQRPYLGYKLIPIDLEKDVFSQIQKKGIDTVIFSEEFESDPEMLKALYFYLPSKVNFLDFTKAYELVIQKVPLSMVSQVRFLENLKEGEKGLFDKIKSFFDIIVSGLILVLSLPLWVLIAIFIKLDDQGPVFYSQQRIGKDRKPFELYKFRSMVVGAEKGQAVWAKKEDERITRVGKFLRRLHFDELPQMINVLRGDISLVGPRPERPEFVEELEKEIPHYHLRHIIKPGFSGWAQIKFRYGRSLMDSKEKFEYDLYYLKNKGLLLDIGILLRTFQLFFRQD